MVRSLKEQKVYVLLLERKPEDYTDEDFENYKDIMIKTNALYSNLTKTVVIGTQRLYIGYQWQHCQDKFNNEIGNINL